MEVFEAAVLVAGAEVEVIETVYPFLSIYYMQAIEPLREQIVHSVDHFLMVGM